MSTIISIRDRRRAKAAQVVRRFRAAAPPAGRRCVLSLGRRARLCLIDRFERSQQRVFGRRFGAAAEPLTLQFVDDLDEPPRRLRPMPQKPRSRANLSTKLYEDLRRAMMDGQFRPGRRLTIAGLAEQYGTSITPVREAISRLASERALEVRAATSIVVPTLTAKDLREIVEIRVDLEGMAAYRTAEIVTKRQIAEFEKLNKEFINAAATNPAQASRANRDFHFKILKHAEMRYLEAICESMWTLMGPFLRTFHEEIPILQLTSSNHSHCKFIEALKSRDPDAARRAMQNDIRWSDALVTAHEMASAAALE